MKFEVNIFYSRETFFTKQRAITYRLYKAYVIISDVILH